MRTCNTPVALESITKHADVSRYFGLRPSTTRSIFASPLSATAAAARSRKAEYYDGLRRFGGMEALTRLRHTWANWKRARANAREEAPLAMRVEARGGPGAAYDAGLAVGMPPAPSSDYTVRRVREAVAAGLPRDLDALARAWLAQQ
jgi:hypothetical protein